MKNVLVLDAQELNVIEKSKAEQIKKIFVPMVEMLESFEDQYNDVILESNNKITQGTIYVAKRLRLDIAKIRIEADKARKEQKDEFLRAGKAIDGVSNILKWAIVEKENKLKEIENHFEIQEKIRLEELQIERVEELSKYIDDASERDLSSMEDDVWIAYISTKKKEVEDKIKAEKQVEIERVAKEKIEKEQERRRVLLFNLGLKWDGESFIYEDINFHWTDIQCMKNEQFEKAYMGAKIRKVQIEKEEEEEKEKVRKENAQLKKDAFEKDRLAKIEEDKRVKKENARIDKEKKEKEKKEQVLAKEKAERERKEVKERAILEAKLKVEREEKERIAKELKTKEDAEDLEVLRKKRLIEAKEKFEQSELSKGDAAKVKDLISDIELIGTKYTFKSKKNKDKYIEVNFMISNIVRLLNK